MGEGQEYAGDGGSIYSSSGLERFVRMLERLVGDDGALWARGASEAMSLRVSRRVNERCSGTGENKRGGDTGEGGADV